MVTLSFASTVDLTASAVNDPTSVSDMAAYKRNFLVMLQIYNDSKPESESHMVKLLNVTHDVKLKAVPCLQFPLKKNTHSLGTQNGYIKFINCMCYQEYIMALYTK